VSLSDESGLVLTVRSSNRPPTAISTRLTPARGPLPELPVCGSVDVTGSVVVVLGIELTRPVGVGGGVGVVVEVDVVDVDVVDVDEPVVGVVGHSQTITLSKATYLRPVVTPMPEI
jgi:hypothetical protein